jgi:uncharacterized protein (DUF2342 family)
MKDGNDNFVYDTKKRAVYQIYPENVPEKLKVSIEQLSRFRPNIAIMETTRKRPEAIKSLE